MKIKCSATKCFFNDNEECFNKQIKIEGLFAKSSIGTFCKSFSQEQKEDVIIDVGVKCNADYCKHNKYGYCFCEELTIYGDGANFRSETQCNSFKLK